MSEQKLIKSRILQRIDNEQNWASVNPILSSAEIVFSRTENGTFMKLGDGRHYLDTPFYQDIKIDESQISSLDFVHIAKQDYERLVATSSVNESTIYFISGDLDAYGRRIMNVADATDISDVVNLGQMMAALDSVSSQISSKADLSALELLPTKTSDLSNDSGFITANDISSKAEISSLSSKADLSSVPSFSIDGQVGDLEIQHVSIQEYEQILEDGPLSNVLYMVSGEYESAFGKQIKNIADGTDLSDAVNLRQLCSTISAENMWEADEAVDSAKRKITTATPVVTGSESTVISQGALATGVACVAGLKGYRYTNTGNVTNSLTFATAPTGWEVSDVVSIVNADKYPDCATISSISGTTVTFTENLPFSSVETDTGWDAKTAYVATKPDVGDVEIGYGAYADGLGTKALNVATHAEGRQTQALGQYAHAEGRETQAQYAAHAEGHQTKASGPRSHAEGYDTTASGSGSHAEGQHTRAAGQASHAEGHSGTAVTDVIVNKGPDELTSDWEQQKFALAKGTASHVEGKDNLALGEYSHAEGLNNIARGPRAHAEGSGTFANGNNAHAEGGGTSATMENSHAEGSNTTASGNRSHAEGSGSEASQNNAHAEGMNTKACSNSTHAEGASTVAGNGTRPSANSSTAEGNFAHAEGNGTFAKGNSSHAEGKSTQALKPYSHAEGLSTTADGNKAHAEGWQTSAAGEDSHAEGGNTQTQNRYEHAQGSYNKSNKANTDFGNAGNTIHSIGIGTSTQRKNAVEVMQNGDVYVISVGGYNGNSLQGKTLQATLSEISGNFQNYYNQNETSSSQQLKSEFDKLSSKAETSSLADYMKLSSDQIQGLSSTVEIRDGSSIDFESGSEMNVDTGAQINMRSGSQLNFLNSHSKAVVGNWSQISVRNSDRNLCVELGLKADLSSLSSLDQQISAKLFKTEYYCPQWISGEVYKGTAEEPCLYRVSYGGRIWRINLDHNLTSTTPPPDNGIWTDVTNQYFRLYPGCRAEGFGTLAGGQYSHAEGYRTYAVTEGAGFTGAHAEGSKARAVGDASHAEGRLTLADMHAAHAEGLSAHANAQYSHAEGENTKTWAKAGHAEGFQTIAGLQSDSTGATQNKSAYAHAEGYTTTAIGKASHAEGLNSIVSGDYAHAEGEQTSAFGYASHSEGLSSLAISSYAHAEGSETSSIGLASHAEGQKTIASGDYSFSQGGPREVSGKPTLYTKASGLGSHAEGSGTLAEQDFSHSEGVGVSAIGKYAHAEGYYTTAKGMYSHAEGSESRAEADGTHAEGRFALAKHTGAHVEGRYAKSDHQNVFVWSGVNLTNSSQQKNENYYYKSNGTGSFNINPVGGLDGFYIGTTPMSEIIGAKAETSALQDVRQDVLSLSSQLGNIDIILSQILSGDNDQIEQAINQI